MNIKQIEFDEILKLLCAGVVVYKMAVFPNGKEVKVENLQNKTIKEIIQIEQMEECIYFILEKENAAAI